MKKILRIRFSDSHSDKPKAATRTERGHTDQEPSPVDQNGWGSLPSLSPS